MQRKASRPRRAAGETDRSARCSTWPEKSTRQSRLRKKQSSERRVSLLFHSRFHAGLYAHVVFHFEGAVNLFAQFVENFAGGVRDVSVLQHARTRQVDGKFSFDPAGPEGEQGYAVAEANRLPHVVGHKNNGAPSFEPEPF